MSIKNEIPWVIFRLKQNSYAIRGDRVSSLSLLNDVTPIAHQPKTTRGILKLRGKTVTALDLRVILGEKSLVEEIKEMTDMISLRKQDHLNWVKALQNTVETGAEFKLATDPHKCAFGKWYDSFETTNHSLRYHLRKIDEPHQKLHATAALVLDCLKNDDINGAKKLIEVANNEYISVIIEILDKFSDIYTRSMRELLIAMENGVPYGLIVDEVLGVEGITQIPDEGRLRDEYDLNFVSGLAQRKNSDEIVALLNDDVIHTYMLNH